MIANSVRECQTCSLISSSKLHNRSDLSIWFGSSAQQVKHPHISENLMPSIGAAITRITLLAKLIKQGYFGPYIKKSFGFWTGSTHADMSKALFVLSGIS